MGSSVFCGASIRSVPSLKEIETIGIRKNVDDKKTCK
jgi:hypothetical protein